MEERCLDDMQISDGQVTSEGGFSYVVVAEMNSIFDRPGQEQTGSAGHAPSPSKPTCTGAAVASVRKPMFLSRPTLNVHQPSLLSIIKHRMIVTFL
jgi:hypothetical protein